MNTARFAAAASDFDAEQLTAVGKHIADWAPVVLTPEVGDVEMPPRAREWFESMVGGVQ